MQAERNFRSACEYIRSAALQKATLAVLPEYHLLNWVPNDPKFKEACGDWQKYVKGYQDLAKECNINIVPGTIVELRDAGTEGERLLNVAYFIDNQGEIIGQYVKKNLWGSIERLHLTSSSTDPHPVFDTPLGKVGILICWDLAFPEAFREMICQGAKLIIVPTFWVLGDCTPEGLAINPSGEALFLDSILPARCFENTCGIVVLRGLLTLNVLLIRDPAIAFANAGGPPGKGYCGLSQICVPYAGAIAKLGSHMEGMAIADLDMEIVENAERNYQVRADLARSDWHYTYRHRIADARL